MISIMNGGAQEHHCITLSGEYDVARKGELSAAFAAVVNGAPVTIDLAEVTYIDSTFLNELASLRLRMEHRPIILVGAAPNILRLFALTKLDRFFVFQ